MSLELAYALTSRLLAFAMLLSGVEYLILFRRRLPQQVWSFTNLKQELESGLPLPRSILTILFSDRSSAILSLLQVLLAAATLFQPTQITFVFLFCVHLLICLRFRGLFNGGSDMMISVLLVGLIIASSQNDLGMQRLGLLYISIHLLYSYFRAGFSKIRSKEWRDGTALPDFLRTSLYGHSHILALRLTTKPLLCRAMSVLTLLFQVSIVLVPFMGRGTALAYFVIALTFHFSVFVSFSLNRFFWAWLAAWPALIYLSSR